MDWREPGLSLVTCDSTSDDVPTRAQMSPPTTKSNNLRAVTATPKPFSVRVTATQPAVEARAQLPVLRNGRVKAQRKPSPLGRGRENSKARNTQKVAPAAKAGSEVPMAIPYEARYKPEATPLPPDKLPSVKKHTTSPSSVASTAATSVSNFLSCIMPRASKDDAAAESATGAGMRSSLCSSPRAQIMKRPNGTHAHLLELPNSVPYAIRLDGDDVRQNTVHLVPAFSTAEASKLRAAADQAAKANGGWKTRAVGCCTQDVLVNMLSAEAQQLIFDAFRTRILPYACQTFGDGKIWPDSLPSSIDRFFIIKRVPPQAAASPQAPGADSRPTPAAPSRRRYDSNKREFGEHTDHTVITVNVPLTTPELDFGGGGTYFPCPCPGTRSKGILLRPVAGDARPYSAPAPLARARTPADPSRPSRSGHAILHSGERKHAGDRVVRGERYVLVAFFYGGERRGNALPKAVLADDEDGSAAVEAALAAPKTLKPAPKSEAPRLITIDDVLESWNEA